MMDTDRTYFTDRDLDRVVGLVMQLAAELHTAQARCRALELLLVRQGVLAEGAVDEFEPDAEEGAQLDGSRDGLIARLLQIMTEDGPSAHPLRGETLRADELAPDA